MENLCQPLVIILFYFHNFVKKKMKQSSYTIHINLCRQKCRFIYGTLKSVSFTRVIYSEILIFYDCIEKYREYEYISVHFVKKYIKNPEMVTTKNSTITTFSK